MRKGERKRERYETNERDEEREGGGIIIYIVVKPNSPVSKLKATNPMMSNLIATHPLFIISPSVATSSS